MNWHERVVDIICDGQQLFGIATVPATAKPTGVVIIVGGPQYRVGSHRQFVLLARRLAAEGYPVLRFDYRGMGDSAGELQQFENVERDVGAALDALQVSVPEVDRVVLWGLCDGASAALLYLHTRADARVSGLLLLNPWIRTAASRAKTQVRFYYLQRLMQGAFWAKLLSGRVAVGALRGFVGSLRAAARTGPATDESALGYPTRMALGWQAFPGRGLLVLSDQDYTAREFEAYCATDPAWTRALDERPLERATLSQADHTCSQPVAENALHSVTIDFLNELPAC